MAADMRVLGIYREAEFSPGKVADDAAILDAVLGNLAAGSFTTTAMDSERFITAAHPDYSLVLAMCQSERALARLAALEKNGAVVVNPALAIRNCYRDLMAAGLKQAGIPVPDGVLVETATPIELRALAGIDPSAGVFVKRGDLHALSEHDVVRADGMDQLREVVASFAGRGLRFAYLQQAVPGMVVKFYGVSGGEYFTALAEAGAPADATVRELSRAAAAAADALGLETWGGDAIVSEGGFQIIDFNDWPSFSRVRDDAARAIARRCERLLRRARRDN